MSPVPALGGDNATLVGHGFADDEFAILKDGGAVTEDEIDGAGDIAVTVELTPGVCVECVLMSLHCAVVEDGHVSSHPQGHCLMFYGSCTVLKSDVLRHEILP